MHEIMHETFLKYFCPLCITTHSVFPNGLEDVLKLKTLISLWLMQAKLWWVSLANILTKVTSFVKQQWITKCLSSLGQTISCVLSEEEPNHRQQEELKQQPWLYWAF